MRVKIDGTVYDINDVPKLDKKLKHSIDVVIDRLVIKEGIDSRLTDSLETAFALGDGLAKVDILPNRDAAEENIPAEKRPQTGESSLRTVWRSCFFLRILPVMSAVSALKKCHRECSRSTARSVPARTAPALVIRKNRSAACCSG